MLPFAHTGVSRGELVSLFQCSANSVFIYKLLVTELPHILSYIYFHGTLCQFYVICQYCKVFVMGLYV
jgi:hypothetical protein